MSNHAALQRTFDQSDAGFFFDHPDRYTHIRKAFQGENEQEFRNLGSHDFKRRMIVLWRIPKDNPWYNPKKPGLLKIPFLKFADETIEDRDDVLLVIVDEIMREAELNYNAD